MESINSFDQLTSAIQSMLELEDELGKVKFDIVDYLMRENLQEYISVDWAKLRREVSRSKSK